MGSSEDISQKAHELIGSLVSRLLSEKSGYRNDELICALQRLGNEISDWRVRAGCKRAVQMLSREFH